MDETWAYARAAGTPEEIAVTLPRLSGTRGARLKLDKRGEPLGPPAGAMRFRGRWHSRGRRGEATVDVIPFYCWGVEVHVGLSAPRGIARRILWDRRHLQRLAGSLADVLAAPVAQTKRPEDVRAQTPPRNTAA